MTAEIKGLTNIEKILLVVYKLGGWGVLAIAACLALRYVWDERTASNAELIKELRDGKTQTIEIISQNASALDKNAEAQKQVAHAVEQLTEEVRRNQRN